MPSLSWVFYEEEKGFQQHSALVILLFPLSLSLSPPHSLFYPEFRLSSWKSHFCNAWVVNYHIHCFLPPKDCKENIENILGTDNDNPANVQ